MRVEIHVNAHTQQEPLKRTDRFGAGAERVVSTQNRPYVSASAAAAQRLQADATAAPRDRRRSRGKFRFREAGVPQIRSPFSRSFG